MRVHNGFSRCGPQNGPINSPRWARVPDHLNRALLVVPLLLAVVLPASAQEKISQTEYWFSYEHKHKVGEKTRVFTQLGNEQLLSSENIFGEWNKPFIKAGLFYDLGSRFQVAGGVGFYYTFRQEIEDLFEFRLWQEGKAFWPESFGVVRRWVLTHRLRFEERFTESDGWNFAMRLRYRLDTKIPINKYTLEPRAFYVPLSVEFFADLIDEAPEFFAQKTRASIGLGYVINKNWTIDLSYHRQHSRSIIEEEFKGAGDVIQLKIKSSFRIRDLIKGR